VNARPDHLSRDLLERVGLDPRVRYRPDSPSGGYRERVALGGALANNPPLLLADETTGKLDSENGARILGWFWDLVRESGKTAVILSHEEGIGEYVVRSSTCGMAAL